MQETKAPTVMFKTTTTTVYCNDSNNKNENGSDSDNNNNSFIVSLAQNSLMYNQTRFTNW